MTMSNTLYPSNAQQSTTAQPGPRVGEPIAGDSAAGLPRLQRLFMLAGTVLAVGLSTAAFFGGGSGSVAVAQSATSASPGPARVATVDIYKIANLLMESERFKPALMAERERLTKELEPLETELLQLQQRLGTATPGDNAARDLAQTFQTKRENYLKTRDERSAAFEGRAAKDNLRAYQEAVGVARRLAEARGFTHVIATRTGEETAPPDTGLQFTFGLLSRPVLLSPGGDDLTSAVMAELKLTEPPATPPSTPGAAQPGAPSGTSGAPERRGVQPLQPVAPIPSPR